MGPLPKSRLVVSGLWTIVAAVSLLTSCETTLTDALPSPQQPEASAARVIVRDARNPLFIPATITNSSFGLTAAPGTATIGSGTTTSVWQYNGSFPGPTIVAKTGDNILATFQNKLPEPTIIHWHGMLVDPANDGQPHQVIRTGETYNYNFPVINRAALNWYHPHPHMTIGKQVYNGLAGAFIIRDAEEAALNLPTGKYEVPLVIRDISLDKSGNPVYSPTGGGYFGKTPLVNGTKDPYLDVDKTVYRFRVLIGSTSRVFKLKLSTTNLPTNKEIPFTLIGNDGGLLPSSSNQTQIEVCPGERLDVLVDFGSLDPSTKVMLQDVNAGWNLLEFRVTNTSASYSGALTVTSSIPTLSAPVAKRFFSFDGMSKINGKLYDMHRIDFMVPFGQTELWTFKTNGNGPHPVHIHGASFQVISRTGGRGRVFPWERGWKDVVLVNDFETVDVLIRFDAYKGVYVMHCHKLEHEDNGMMMNFEVK
ncbi:multicopper oxidase family protein [Nibrella saemangeumensis]|uniref:Multicopper oxidase family protein n=1 Tax=Nibrella saemangeumensis TaxID=1084526 RepID=A0ABP8N7Z4_9BACT